MVPKRICVWGHPLHSHTHSYVHAAFVKAFRAMGFETFWLKDGDDAGAVDCPETLFLTEGQVDAAMPARKDCWYVLHNCKQPKYGEVPKERRLSLQVYTDACLRHSPDKIDDGVYFQDGHLYQPWATDLLPHEIDLAWAGFPRGSETYWVGTVGGGRFGNECEIAGFKRACEENKIRWIRYGSISFQENLELVRKSWMAPAIHGTWQCQNGYVACRVFKNISYGALGVTNCEAAQRIMEGSLVYNKDSYQMAQDAMPVLGNRERVREQMKLVRDKHTYLNRIKTILRAMGLEK